jgi:tRNA modification GTPase
MDTIFALASAPGRAGVAVLRISGPSAHAAAQTLAGPLPVHGRRLCRLRDPAGGLIDEALCLTFAPGRSFTAEATAELHCHGSGAVITMLQQVLGAIPGLRPAEPGEFTRRAMENGRLDLAQVEGLADLIEAETEAQRRQALRVFSGALGDKAAAWRERLVQAAALIAAGIDFADEDIDTDTGALVADLLAAVITDLDHEAAGVHAAERIRDGFEVAILGAPNTGKSTLLNALAGREAAITADLPGTTRDIIEVRMDLAGLPVTLLDTAGLRDTDDPVERIGVDRARSRAARADLRIWLLGPGDRVADDPPEGHVGGDIVLRGRADINPGAGPGISGLIGDGIPELIAAVTDRLGHKAASAGVALRERHRLAMQKAAAHLEQALADLPMIATRPEILAEEVNLAIRAIDSIVGRVDVEDILGEIFARFCIGK